MNHDSRVLSEALRSLRESTSLSTDDVAKRLQVEPAILLGYESGELELPSQQLMAYLHAIGRSLLDLHFVLNPEPENPRLQAFLTELADLHLQAASSS